MVRVHKATKFTSVSEGCLMYGNVRLWLSWFCRVEKLKKRENFFFVDPDRARMCLLIPAPWPP